MCICALHLYFWLSQSSISATNVSPLCWESLLKYYNLIHKHLICDEKWQLNVNFVAKKKVVNVGKGTTKKLKGLLKAVYSTYTKT